MQKITENEEQQRVKRCQKSEAEILKPSKNEEDGKQNLQESEAEIEKSKEMKRKMIVNPPFLLNRTHIMTVIKIPLYSRVYHRVRSIRLSWRSL